MPFGTKGLGNLAQSIKSRLVPYIKRVKEAGQRMQESAMETAGPTNIARAKKVGKAAVVGGAATLGYKAGKKVEKTRHETGLLRGPKRSKP